MDNKLARSLIRDTFTQRFEKGRFLHFVRNLLNHINESKATAWNKTYIKDAYKLGINRFERVGTYTDPAGEQIDVLIVHLEKESSLERARTFLRNFVADYLATRGQKDAALAAFISPSENDWRFSLVKMEYETKQSDSGVVKVTETFTPARRYSFLVGESEDSHTAQAQLLDILAETDRDPSLEDLERAFSVERVTKEFFEQYKDLFLDLKDELDDLTKRDSRVRRDFESKSIETVDFAKKLLGQVVFLYFLQKKGWFGVERDAEWGTGPKNYLRQLFQSRDRIGAFAKSGKGGVNFFNDILEPLFYEALAKGEREDDYYGHFHCKIPFLNGGLFDPLNGYDWVHTDISLPDELFSNQNKTEHGDSGTGILDVFDRYNFTVNEAEPLEKEVAVDPEMLGKVFENLLEIRERKSKGSYYTPREIVHYMGRESLLSHLEKQLAAAKVNRADLETLIRFGEQAADFELARLDKSTGYKHQLPKSIEQNAFAIDHALAEITVCDPAVGSGAFLVGMMTEIVRVRKTLTPYFSNRTTRTVYEFKRHAIQSSLYGVDIDPSAVEIAKLRLWLSLVVDEDDIKEIKPLPNLDYKIMQGDSLVEEFEGVKLFDKRLIEQPALDLKSKKAALNNRIGELSRQFFDLHGRGHRDKQTRSAIEKEIAKLKKEMKALEAPVATSTLPVQREIDDLFSEAQRKLPQLEKLHSELFEASSGALKKKIREELTALEWEIMDATVRDGIRQILERLDHLKHELSAMRRKKDESSAIEKLELRIEALNSQKTEREEAAKHLQALRTSNVKPFFLWRLHFLEVFKRHDGFDIVIGNPPYIRVQTLQDSAPKQVEYLKSHYSAASKGNFDIYVVFVERGLRLLQQQGNLAFILPHKFFNAKYGASLRELIANGKHLRHVVHFGDQQIFPGATNYVCLLFLAEAGINECRWVRVDDLSRWLRVFQAPEVVLPSSRVTSADWNFGVGRGSALFERLERMPVKLEHVTTRIFQGIKTSADKIYIVEELKRTKSLVRVFSRELNDEFELEPDLLHPLIKGGDSKRYLLSRTKRLIIFPYAADTRHETYLISQAELKASYPLTWKYFKANKRYLEDREDGKMKHSGWYGFGRTQALDVMPLPKLFTPDISPVAAFSYDSSGELFFTGGVAGGYGLLVKSPYRSEFVLGLVNSRLLDFFHHRIATQMRGGWFSYEARFIRQVPIRPIDFFDSADQALHDSLAELVEKILVTKKDLSHADTDPEKKRLHQLCSDLEDEINQLVYRLYDLTDDEIAIVESNS
jgi:type I restriction-modification system DNA methylase subunit